MYANSPRFRRARLTVLAVALDCERESRRELQKENLRLKRELDQSQTAVAFLVKGRCDAPHFPSNN